MDTEKAIYDLRIALSCIEDDLKDVKKRMKGIQEFQEVKVPESYLRLVTPDEIDSFYTVKVKGVLIRAYFNKYGRVYLCFADGKLECFFEDNNDKMIAICGALNIPIMPYSESNSVYKPPKPSTFCPPALKKGE